MKTLVYFETENGKIPFIGWYDRLDKKSCSRVEAYIERLIVVSATNNVRRLGEIFELKIHFGPGYRVYFGEDNEQIILLLLGGDKSTQFRDIEKAKEYWRQYAQKKRLGY